LETARRTINRLEEEIEVKHAVLSAEPGFGARPPQPEPGEWDEDAGVRIVPAGRALPPEEVDPDAFIAEVEQLQSAPPTSLPAASESQLEDEGDTSAHDGDEAGRTEMPPPQRFEDGTPMGDEGGKPLSESQVD